MDTNNHRPDGAQDEDPAASWTNEMLSMPVRRQLLDRDLRKVIDRRQSHGHEAGAQDDARGGGHPQGHGETQEHGG